MKRITISLFILLMTSTGCNNKNNQSDIQNKTLQEPPVVSVAEFKKIAEADTTIFVLDVRTESEYVAARLNFTDDRISYDSLYHYLDLLPDNKETPIYCFCRSGRRSGIATEYLNSIGYKNVYNVTGGILAWRDAGYDIISGKP